MEKVTPKLCPVLNWKRFYDKLVVICDVFKFRSLIQLRSFKLIITLT